MRENAKDPVLAARRAAGFNRTREQNRGKTLEEVYGSERAEEIRQKLKISHQGKSATHETRKKMSLTRKKLRPSEETKAKLSFVRKQKMASGEIILSPKAGSGRGGFREDLGHYVRSTYEYLFAKRLKDFSIAYEYEPEVFETAHGSYRPDFKIAGKYYEIKNSFNANDPLFLKKKQAMLSEHCLEITVLIGDQWSKDQNSLDLALYTHHLLQDRDDLDQVCLG